jgi:protein-S-isoprenylcysteine O-methyltransferase Ste14
MKQSRFFRGILIASTLIGVQYVLAFFVYELPGLPVLQWIGWGIWVLSAIFGIAPIFILRRRGGVAKGKSYVHTTHLVDTSLYAIVRHPQYLAGILFNLSMMLLALHWLVILVGLIPAALIYAEIQAADREGIEKFGDEYRLSVQRVPQVNVLLGGARLLQRKGSFDGRTPH